MAEDKIEADDLSDDLLHAVSLTASLAHLLRARRPISAADLFADLLTVAIEHGIVTRTRPTTGETSEVARRLPVTEETFEVTSQWPVDGEDKPESFPTWDAAYVHAVERVKKWHSDVKVRHIRSTDIQPEQLLDEEGCKFARVMYEVTALQAYKQREYEEEERAKRG